MHHRNWFLVSTADAAKVELQDVSAECWGRFTMHRCDGLSGFVHLAKFRAAAAA
jgi:hypothetical protein